LQLAARREQAAIEAEAKAKAETQCQYEYEQIHGLPHI
jgi:hypothetical protein